MSPASLLVHIAPLALVGAVSPVMFLNGSRVVSERGIRGGREFALGAVLVLATLGVATMGLIGAAAAAYAERELASRWVDAVLALVLLGYGLQQAMTMRQRRDRTESTLPASGGAMVSWGALGMATNFTSLPLFMSCSQQIGASTVGLGWKFLLLVLVVAVVSIPAWVPGVAHRLHPEAGHLSLRMRARISRTTQTLSVAACILGGALLLWHVLGG